MVEKHRTGNPPNQIVPVTVPIPSASPGTPSHPRARREG